MPEQPADAPLSDDGQWWWDGAERQPVESGPQPVTTRTRPREYYPEVMALAHASDMENWLINVVGISQHEPRAVRRQCSPTAFRERFRRVVRTSPHAYRAAFATNG